MEPEMTDDDVAASLGYITRLSEDLMTPPEEPADIQEPTEQIEEEKEDLEGDTDGTPAKDEEQDREIAEIRSELERLLAEENQDDGTEDENTEPAR